MRLDLREIINIPGAGVTFNYEPDLSGLSYGSVNGIKPPTRAVGSIRNSAGILKFSADVSAVMMCTCSRCLKDFEFPVNLHLTTTLTEQESDEEILDIFLFEGDFADVDDIISTEFILNMDQRLLCSDDCKGLCERCGADLNSGPCACKSAVDPRLSVLEQLLADN